MGRSVTRARRTDLIAKRVVIVVICLVIGVVGVLAVFALTYDETKIVKSQLDELARTYYEEYTYPGLIKNVTGQTGVEQLMERYVDRGFADVRLRQLIRYDGGKTVGDVSLIRKHCDENETMVRVFPEEPFDVRSYRIEYKYDCDF